MLSPFDCAGTCDRNEANNAGGIAGYLLALHADRPRICVTVGGFVGGALAAFGTSYAW